MLLVSPERLNNPDFRDEVLPALAARRRPRRRRRGALRLRLGPRLPSRLPPHPHADRRARRGHPGAGDHRDRQRPGRRRRRRAARVSAGAETLVLRGGLDRESLRLSVVQIDEATAARGVARPATEPAARLRHRLHPDGGRRPTTWPACSARPGATPSPPTPGTPRPPNASSSRPTCSPTGSRRSSRRPRSAWVSTNPTSGSSCTSAHRPSPIAYYQQVGRAGRSTDRAEVVLLPGHEDRRRSGATSPSRRRSRAKHVVRNVIRGARPRAAAVRRRRSSRWWTSAGPGWRWCSRSSTSTARSGGSTAAGSAPASRGSTTTPRYARLDEARAREQQAMLDYQRTDRCAGWSSCAANSTTRASPPTSRAAAATTAPAPLDRRRRRRGAAEARARLMRPGVDLTPRKQWPSGLAKLGVAVRQDHRRSRSRAGCSAG